MGNIKDFDIEKWLNWEDATAASPLPSDSRSETEKVEELVDALTQRGICITEDYNDWIKVGFALADSFGESGRALFHRLSSLSSKYDHAQCDKKYENCLRSSSPGRTSCSTLFYLASQAGLDLHALAHEHRTDNGNGLEKESQRAKCATVPLGTVNRKIEKNNNFTILCDSVPVGTVAHLAHLTGYTFTDKIDMGEWPTFLLPILNCQQDTADRDKMMLGALNILSGIIPKSLYGIYDRRKIYAPLYNIIFGGFATKKGDLEACRELIAPIKLEMRRAYEKQKMEYLQQMMAWENTPKGTRGAAPEEPLFRSPFIPANSSASAVYRALHANGEWGVIFESEADSLTNMLSKGEYGDYTDLLRRVHHHETTTMSRVTDHLFIELQEPRLAVLLTCTGSQLPLLLPSSNVANGLASRFLFYALPENNLEFRNVFAGEGVTLTDTFAGLGQEVLKLYHALEARESRPLQFIMTPAQQQQFVEAFNGVLVEQFEMLGDGIQGYIFRLALECYRYAMVLTALRRLSERMQTDEMIFDEEEQALACDERDFHIALSIIQCLVNHTARVYSVIGQHDDDPFAQAPEPPSTELKRFFESLPSDEFKTADAVAIAQELKIPERTAKRMLGNLTSKYQVLDRPKYATYIKRKMK